MCRSCSMVDSTPSSVMFTFTNMNWSNMKWWIQIKAVVEAEMQRDDETTAIQLHNLLLSRGYKIGIRTVLHCRTSLGWTLRGSAYGQLIRDVSAINIFTIFHLNSCRPHAHFLLPMATRSPSAPSLPNSPRPRILGKMVLRQYDKLFRLCWKDTYSVLSLLFKASSFKLSILLKRGRVFNYKTSLR